MTFALLAAGFCPARGGVSLRRTVPRTKKEIRDREQAHKKEQDMLKRLTQYGEQASKGCPLYASVKAELESYYDRTRSSSSEGVAACRAFQRHLRGRSAGRIPPVPQGYW